MCRPRVQCAPQHHRAEVNDGHRPDQLKTEMDNMKTVGEEAAADEDHKTTEQLASDGGRFHGFRKAEGDEDHGPVAPYVADAEEPHVIEQKADSERDNSHPENHVREAGMVVVAAGHAIVDAVVDLFPEVLPKPLRVPPLLISPILFHV